MKLTHFILGTLLGGVSPFAYSAQQCNDAAPSTAPDERYQIHLDGTVTDLETGLMWQRCAQGQEWDGAGCSGSAPGHTWSEALQQAEIANQQQDLSYQDWRLPNKKELASLVEKRCFDPAINLSVFPKTPSYWFWSSSPNADFPDSAWFVSFHYGFVGNLNKSNTYAVRLVRAGQSFAFLPDTRPDAFDFNDLSDVNRSVTLTSNSIIINGINATTTIEVNFGEYSINSGAWRSAAGEVNNNDRVKVRHVSATGFEQTVTQTLTIGDQSGQFSSTTEQQSTVEVSGKGIIEGRVLNGCNQKPFSLLNVDFEGVSGNFKSQQTDRNGRYVIGLDSGEYTVSTEEPGFQEDRHRLNLVAGETRIANFNLLPSNGCSDIQPAKTRQALIIAGSGPQLPNGINHIWKSSLALADWAYLALTLQGYQAEDIRYLSADGKPRDADGDGDNDVNATATLETVEEMLTQWAGGVEQLVVYLVGHGGVESFQLERNRDLTPRQLNDWLNSAQSRLTQDQRGEPGKLTLILDACKSGSFIPALAADNRYVVTSTSADLDAKIANQNGSNSFSYHFWNQIGFKDGWLSTAFQQARQAMSGELVARGKKQTAMLDADGSGGETSPNDYAVVDNYCYGDCDPHASTAIVIESVSPLEELNGNIKAKLKVRASKTVEKAWVTIQRPDYHFPSDGTAVSSVLQLNLTCQDSTCEAEYNNFNINDFYPVSFYVQDRDDNVSLPFTLNLYQNGIANNTEKSKTTTVFEETTGVLTLKDVAIGEQHFYVEMIYLGDGKFNIQNYYPMNEGASDEPAIFDGVRVKIAKAYALGKFYRFDLIVGEGLQFLIDWESFQEL